MPLIKITTLWKFLSQRVQRNFMKVPLAGSSISDNLIFYLKISRLSEFLQKMPDRCNGMVKNHFWSYCTHYISYLFPFFTGVAMCFAFFASGLVITIFASVQFFMCKLYKFFTLRTKRFIFLNFTAINLNHQSDCLFLLFNSCHSTKFILTDT